MRLFLVLLQTIFIQIVDPCPFGTDNFCDDENNNAGCGWDGGACCNNQNAGWDQYCTACECLSK